MNLSEMSCYDTKWESVHKKLKKKGHVAVRRQIIAVLFLYL